MSWLLLAAVALVAAAALCQLAEVALLRVSRVGPADLARAGGVPERLQGVLTQVTRYVAVLALVRVAAQVGAVVLVTALLRHWMGPGWGAFAAAAAAMTAVLFTLAEVLPRALGQRHAARVAGPAAAVLHPLVRLLGPVPALLLAIGRLAGPGQPDGGAEDDLRGLVDLLRRRRVIDPTEREMIHSVVEFGDTIVREVMVPRTDMVFVESDKTLRQGLSLALRSGFSRIPVVGRNLDDVVGIAYLKDIVKRIYEHRDADTQELVCSIMRPATFVPDSKPVDDLLAEMQARQIHLAIVIDEYGGTAGLVTIEDVLEEIVGEIADEYDTEQPEVEWLGVDRARVTARLSVTDLEELFGVRIEAEDVETVGGLLAQRLGRVPIAGSTVTVAGLRLTAESLAGRRNRIGTVTVVREQGIAEPRGTAADDGARARDPGDGPVAGPAGSSQESPPDREQPSRPPATAAPGALAPGQNQRDRLAPEPQRPGGQ